MFVEPKPEDIVVRIKIGGRGRPQVYIRDKGASRSLLPNGVKTWLIEGTIFQGYHR
jgi:hypothetical protein